MLQIDRAFQVALKAHSGQMRKGTLIPYISHPVAVSLRLSRAGCSEDEIIAGVLHDCVEDTELTLDDIRREFGESVAEIVEGCSEPDKELSWEDRKSHTIEFLKTAPVGICRVVCGDKLHNIATISQDLEQVGQEVWSRFNRSKEQQAWYYRGIIQSMDLNPEFDSQFGPYLELREVVKIVFGD